MRGVWINGEHKNPDARPLGLGWDTMLPFWGTLLPFEGDIRPGRNSVCALVEAETTGFFPVDGGALSALIRLHRKGGVIDRIVSGPDWRVRPKIGRASCRERVCQYVSISVVAVALKKKTKN